MAHEKHVAIIYSAGKGLLDDVPADKVRQFEESVLEHLDNNHSDLLTSIKTSGEVSSEVGDKIVTAVTDFKKGFLS